MVDTVGSRYAREDKKEGDIGVQKVLVPVNKNSFCSSFMSSSVPHETAARQEAVPVSSPHSGRCGCTRSARSTQPASAQH